jgi:pseudouridine synthase
MAEPYPAHGYDAPMRRRSPTHPYQDDSRGPRIQKVLADAGVGSRRACEEAVEEGRVTVNGHRIDGLPAWVNPAEDDIRFDGRRLRPAERHVYVMLFKPKGYLSTNSDPEGRPRAIDLVSHPAHARLYSVGRLDLDSSGLMLLTNDGELANRLTHPRFEMHKGYEVMVSGRVEDADVRRLEAGLFPAGRGAGAEARTTKSHLVVLKRDASRTLLYMELREGRMREIRRTLVTLGHPVRKLRRVKMGPLQLKGLQAGEWRELTPKELAILREHAFATPQQRAARREERRPSPVVREERRPSARREERRPAPSAREEKRPAPVGREERRPAAPARDERRPAPAGRKDDRARGRRGYDSAKPGRGPGTRRTPAKPARAAKNARKR